MGGIAVIIPYFQREPGILARAIRSALSQVDVGPVTIVVCDDASPVPAAADLALLDDGERACVRLLRQANAGAGAARNAALDAVPLGTEWIAFLDSDDQWLPGHLSRAVEALQAGYDLCFADARREHETLSHFAAAEFEPCRHPTIGTSPALHRFDGDFLTLNIALSPVSISTVVIRASALGDLRFRPIPVEDLMFWFDAARRQPRIAVDGTLQVLYGRGNITVTESWKSPAALRMTLMYHRIFMRVGREFALSLEQRTLLERRLERNRHSFCMTTLAQLRDGRLPAWSIISDFLRLDPRVATLFVGTVWAELARRSPFRRRPAIATSGKGSG